MTTHIFLLTLLVGCASHRPSTNVPTFDACFKLKPDYQVCLQEWECNRVPDPPVGGFKWVCSRQK